MRHTRNYPHRNIGSSIIHARCYYCLEKRENSFFCWFLNHITLTNNIPYTMKKKKKIHKFFNTIAQKKFPFFFPNIQILNQYINGINWLCSNNNDNDANVNKKCFQFTHYLNDILEGGGGLLFFYSNPFLFFV